MVYFFHRFIKKLHHLVFLLSQILAKILFNQTTHKVKDPKKALRPLCRRAPVYVYPLDQSTSFSQQTAISAEMVVMVMMMFCCKFAFHGMNCTVCFCSSQQRRRMFLYKYYKRCCYSQLFESEAYIASSRRCYISLDSPLAVNCNAIVISSFSFLAAGTRSRPLPCAMPSLLPRSASHRCSSCGAH